jgi:hypothetical protein
MCKILSIVEQANLVLEHSSVFRHIRMRPLKPCTRYAVRIVKPCSQIDALPIRVPYPELVLPSRIHIHADSVTELRCVDRQHPSLDTALP